MKKQFFLCIIFFLLACSVIFGIFLYFNSLTFKIQKALWGKDCTVSAAVLSKRFVFEFNNKNIPLMSVFKYFVAVAVLNKLEDEEKSLNDKVLVKEDMIIRTTYTPMLEKYPKTPFYITIADLMKYMVSESDNNATDILINYIGGMQKLQMELKRYHFSNIRISADEKMMETDFNNQYINTAPPMDVIEAMQLFRENASYTYILHPLQTHSKICLTDEHKKFLDKIMIETVTGSDKIKAGLPDNVIFGHKTGRSSRKPDGVRIADNDAGFVIFPDGETYYIAIFISESKMNDNENVKLISEISKIIHKHVEKAKKENRKNLTYMFLGV